MAQAAVKTRGVFSHLSLSRLRIGFQSFEFYIFCRVFCTSQEPGESFTVVPSALYSERNFERKIFHQMILKIQGRKRMSSWMSSFFIDEEFLAFLIKLPFKTSIAWFGIWWISGKKMERFNLKCGLRLVGYSWVEVGLGWDTPLVINLRWFHRNSGKFLRESIWGDRLTKFELYLSCTLFWPSEKLKRLWYIIEMFM